MMMDLEKGVYRDGVSKGENIYKVGKDVKASSWYYDQWAPMTTHIKVEEKTKSQTKLDEECMMGMST